METNRCRAESGKDLILAGRKSATLSDNDSCLATFIHSLISARRCGKLGWVLSGKERELKRALKTWCKFFSMATFLPKTKREYLALMIAEAFHDETQITLYLRYCQKYPVSVLYRAFAEAQSVPLERVKKSRAAIFFYLIKRYTHDSHTQPSLGPETGQA